MYPVYYGAAILLSIAALIGTIVIAKNMNKEENQQSPKDDAEKLKGEKSNINSIPLLSTIYAVTFGVTIVLVWVFIF